MRVYINEDERYPVYYYHEAPDNSASYVDVPEETIAKWDEIQRLYNEVQDEMCRYRDQQVSEWRERQEEASNAP